MPPSSRPSGPAIGASGNSSPPHLLARCRHPTLALSRVRCAPELACLSICWAGAAILMRREAHFPAVLSVVVTEKAISSCFVGVMPSSMSALCVPWTSRQVTCQLSRDMHDMPAAGGVPASPRLPAWITRAGLKPRFLWRAAQAARPAVARCPSTWRS